MALEATLDTPLGIVRVSSVHLEYFSAEQRAAQVERLRELHREAVLHARIGRRGGAGDGPFRAVPRGAAALIAGDFNFLPGSAEHGRMQAPFADVRRVANRPSRPAACALGVGTGCGAVYL